MKSSVIIYRRRRYAIQPLDAGWAYVWPKEAKRAPTDADAFIRIWKETEVRFGRPPLQWRGGERNLAGKLARTWGLDNMRDLLVYWYHHFYEPVLERNAHPLTSFAYDITAVSKEMKS